MALPTKHTSSADALLYGLAKRAAITIGPVVTRESLNREETGAVDKTVVHSVDKCVIKAIAPREDIVCVKPFAKVHGGIASAKFRQIVPSQTGAR